MANARAIHENQHEDYIYLLQYILLCLSWISTTTPTTTNCDYGSTLEKLLRSGLTLLNDINSHFCLRKCNALTHIRVATLPFPPCRHVRRPLSVSTFRRTGRRRTTQTRIYRSSLAFSLRSHLFHIFFLFRFSADGEINDLSLHRPKDAEK